MFDMRPVSANTGLFIDYFIFFRPFLSTAKIKINIKIREGEEKKKVKRGRTVYGKRRWRAVDSSSSSRPKPAEPRVVWREERKGVGKVLSSGRSRYTGWWRGAAAEEMKIAS